MVQCKYLGNNTGVKVFAFRTEGDAGAGEILPVFFSPTEPLKEHGPGGTQIRTFTMTGNGKLCITSLFVPFLPIPKR